jgi:3-oxoadipate enol-lactonase
VTRFAALDDALIAYEMNGEFASSVPLLYVHGFPHSRTLWRHQLQGMPPHVNGIAVDLRGFGESRGGAVRSVDAHADDLVRLLDHLGIDDAICCGLSMGGYIAFALWRRHPSRVRALVLADTKMGADTPDARARRDSMMSVASERGSAAVTDLLLGGMVGAHTTAERPDIVDEVRQMMAAQTPEAIIDALHALRDRPDSRDTLPTITVPTLLVCGTDDTITPPAESTAMHALLANAPLARLELVERAGHASCLERPAAFNCVLAEFVAEVAAR